MSDSSELAWLDATAQAELVRRREVTPGELVAAAISRIEALNPRLNAVVTPLFDRARAAAAEMERRGPLAGAPFAGVPFLLKDLVAELGGVRLTDGSAFFRDHVPAEDSELVARLKRAGLIVLGKTNTPEFGLVPTTEPRLFGPCRNPWDLGRSTGGSSGGSSAAVAVGMVPMAHANDGGGSIRIPASCCGLFGLKPTRGRNPLGPRYGDIACGLVAEHAVTRSVRDSAALLDATAGPAPGDPYAAPPPARSFLREVGADPGRLRIALSLRPLTGIAVHADCEQAAREAARLCADLGHEVVEAQPAVDGEALVRHFGTVWLAFLGWAIRDSTGRTGRAPDEAHFEPATWRAFQAGRKILASDLLLAVQALQRMGREIGAWFLRFDGWLTPTLAQPPVPLGYFDYDPAQPERFRERLGHYTHFTLPWNVTGQPAMSVPLAWNAAGLPIGVQFVARFGDEATLFRLAAQLEQARPWATRRPPVSA